MSKYAKLLFPVEKHKIIGPFKLPIYNDLVPGEAKRLEEVTRKYSEHTYKSLQLAKRIATDKGITVKEAVDLLGRADAPENESLVLEYVSELEEIQASEVGAVTQRIAFVTVLLKYRAEIKLPGQKNWQPIPDWSEEDTEHIPSALLEELFQFLQYERDGWPEPGKQEDDQQSDPPKK